MTGPSDATPDADNVVLVGLRATGKTELGRRLALRLGRPFLDTDALVEEIAGRAADALLAQRGEAAFRLVERQALVRAARARGTVVATGGGAVLNGEEFARLAATGVVVHLTAPVDELVRRARARPRPALLPLPLAEEVEALHAARTPLYRAVAQITVPVDRGDPILALLDRLSEFAIG